MLTIGLFPNTKKANVAPVLKQVVTYLKRHNIRMLMTEKDALAMNYPELAFDQEQLSANINLAVTLGGDGTMLQSVRFVAAAGVPVCGVNLGQLGFLPEIEIDDLEQGLSRLINGEYSINERLMLDAVVIRDGQEIHLSSALNDVVVSRGGCSRMIRLKLYLNGELTEKYPADGLIVATSTGSTGYSLSAGGPIVSPGLNVILITPICPHALHARPIVVAETEEIRLVIAAPHEDIMVTSDGQHNFEISPTDEVVIRRSRLRARFVSLSTTGHLCRLRSKLWKADNEEQIF
ncbi:MAG: ppnK [Firmicutes bacterium]|nr:ppnK [Bacillota bacterium]